VQLGQLIAEIESLSGMPVAEALTILGPFSPQTSRFLDFSRFEKRRIFLEGGSE
jgi:hypothetical protein